jgi:YVTN family beta-propeller protein
MRWNSRARISAVIGAVALLAASCNRSPAEPDATGPRVYVTNEMSGDLTIIDPQARQVVGRIALGKRPRGITPSPDGALLYIALSGSPVAGPGIDEASLPPADKGADGIAVFDVGQGRVLRILRGISDPETVAVSPDGARLYVASEDSGQLVVMDARNGRIMAQVAVGEEPEGVAVSPDGALALATSEGTNAAAVIDTSTMRVRGQIPVGQRPRNVVFLSADRTLIPGENDASLTLIDPQAGRFVGRTVIPGENVRPMGLAVASGSIFVTTGRGGELVRVGPDLQVTGRVRVGERPWGVAASADGRFLFTANGPSNDVAMVDARSMQVVARFPAGDRPWGIAMVATGH